MTDCSKHIRADYATLCGTPKYDTYKLIAGCVFGVVSIGMPLALSLYIRRNRKALLDNAPHQTPSATALGLGFFYRVYKEKKAHWEVVELFGKLAVTSLVGFIDPDTPLQLYVGIAFAGQHPLGPPSLCRRERSLASLASLAAAPHVCSGQRTVRTQNDVLSTPATCSFARRRPPLGHRQSRRAVQTLRREPLPHHRTGDDLHAWARVGVVHACLMGQGLLGASLARGTRAAQAINWVDFVVAGCHLHDAADGRDHPRGGPNGSRRG